MCDMDMSYDDSCDIEMDVEFDEESDTSFDMEISENTGEGVFESLEFCEDVEEFSETTEYDESFECYLSELDDIQPEVISTELLSEMMEENADDAEFMSQLERLFSSGRISIESSEFEEEDSPKEYKKILRRNDI